MLGRHSCETLEIDDLASDATVRVENAHQNGQTRHNTMSLRKCRLQHLILDTLMQDRIATGYLHTDTLTRMRASTTPLAETLQ